MHVRWYLYRFDYARFLALRPLLRTATSPADLVPLAGTAETDAIIEALEDGEIVLGEALSAFCQALCFVGTPLPVDSGMARLVATMQRIVSLEDAGELLNVMLGGGHNIEPWLRPAGGLAGFLTPQEVSQVHSAWVTAEPRALKRARLAGRRRRRGGLLGQIIRLLQHLGAGGPQADDTFRLLSDLLMDAAEKNEGIAAIRIGR